MSMPMPSAPGLTGRLGLSFEHHTPRADSGLAVDRMRARLGPLHRRYLAEAAAHRQLYALDARLARTLRGVASGWRVDDVNGLCARGERALLAFDDSWTATGWSTWWSIERGADRAIDVVILHADDHKDVTTPFLMPDGDAWIDLLTGDPVSLRNPRSVADAVVSGAIGIGTFVAPWLHTWRRIELRHLRAGAQSERAALVPTRARVEPLAAVSADAESSEIWRPAIEMTSAGVADASLYIGTDDLQVWTADIPADAAVLLHIDLDYFNDRYGGGRPSGRREPTAFESLTRIREMSAALAAAGVPSRIEHTAICCSPGFCPSECWEPLLWHLRDALTRIGCPCI